MATTKKSAPKKPVTKKTPAKKPAAAAKKATASKAAPVKRSAAKSSKPRKVVSYQTLRASQSLEPFTSMRITRQTVYWVILIAFIIFVQLWILSLQIEVASLIESQQSTILGN